jgi:threonine aldolase
VIVGAGAHPVWYECGASPVLSGVQFAIAGTSGLFTADEMEAEIKPSAYYCPRTSLVCIENTHNRAGGRVFPQEQAKTIAERARARGLALHLDGARLWNASAASGRSVAELSAPFDTVSVCFSKGLGAPVGSALAGPREVITRARRFRKMWGGGMRQAGILAAAALHALEHHRTRLTVDHAHAQKLAHHVSRSPGVSIELRAVETNIVNIDLEPPLSAETVAEIARQLGVIINPSAPHRLRAVTHLDVSEAQIDLAGSILGQAIEQAASKTPRSARP